MTVKMIMATKFPKGSNMLQGTFWKEQDELKKDCYFKEEPKKTYFFKESIMYPFVQFSTLKMELYLTNNDFADI